jgi:lipopolysaccharide transport system ATP-binding protein
MNALSVRELSKAYLLGTEHAAFGSVRSSLGELLRLGTPRRRERMWALQDVSFDVAPGEAIGVIGPNGAGKSTLLKILSRITEPTSGEAIVRGRIGSLLEVGTGFHPDLTGRENIFLNGAILGMHRSEIKRKFDEIVAFAGVERFLDTPVKRYSSGMYVRLAFAVAAHLDTDILLVDEVLSVGDFAFQRRSLGKMREQTTNEGRTVLFVSHNLSSVKMLTRRCLWLENGRIRRFGPTEDVFREYVLEYGAEASSGFIDHSDISQGRPDKADPLVHDATLEWVELRNSEGATTATHLVGDALAVRVGLRARRPLRHERIELRCRVYTLEGLLVFTAGTGPCDVDWSDSRLETGFVLDPNPLGPGTYLVELLLLSFSESAASLTQDLIRSAATFAVIDNPEASPEGYAPMDRNALIRVSATWSDFEPAREPARTLSA